MLVLGTEPNFCSKDRKGLKHSVVPPSQDGPDPSWRLAQAHLVNEKSQGSEGLGDFQKICPETQRTPGNLGRPLRRGLWSPAPQPEVGEILCPQGMSGVRVVSWPPQPLLPGTYQKQEAAPPVSPKGRCQGYPRPNASKREKITDHQRRRASSPGTWTTPFRCSGLPPAA